MALWLAHTVLVIFEMMKNAGFSIEELLLHNDAGKRKRIQKGILNLSSSQQGSILGQEMLSGCI